MNSNPSAKMGIEVAMHKRTKREAETQSGAGRSGSVRVPTVFFTSMVIGAAWLPLLCARPSLAQKALPDTPKAHCNGRREEPEPYAKGTFVDKEETEQGNCGSAGEAQSSSSEPHFEQTRNAALPPMSSSDKLRYAVGNSISPFAFIEAASKAGFYQETGFRKKYGSGASGYFKQFGASWGDSALRNMTGSYLYASLLHEDPRYYRRGEGGFGNRLWYAVNRTFVTRRDEGGAVFNWASVLGSTTSAGLSNFYLPANDRTASMGVENTVWFLAGTAANNVIQEFLPGLYHHLNKHP